MRPLTEDKVLAALNVVRYATVYNFEPHLFKTADTLEGRLQNPYRCFLRLLKKGVIKQIPVKPEGDPLFKYNKFYQPQDGKVETIRYSMLRHESGVADILLAFYYLYPDYDMTVKIRPKYSNGSMSYYPDAHISLTKGDTSYSFILEFERTREPEDITKKLDKILSLGRPETFGLDPKTRLLIVSSHQNYSGYFRPSQYNDDEVKRQHALLDIRFSVLQNIINKYPASFCLMNFKDFYRLNESVWYTSKKEFIKIVH